jgi:hypothetical protein
MESGTSLKFSLNWFLYDSIFLHIFLSIISRHCRQFRFLQIYSGEFDFCKHLNKKTNNKQGAFYVITLKCINH